MSAYNDRNGMGSLENREPIYIKCTNCIMNVYLRRSNGKERMMYLTANISYNK